MLYYESIDPPTLEVLKSLLQIPEFNGLRLVGGTSLALQIGHRKSVDIDLFGSLEADELGENKKVYCFKPGGIPIIKVATLIPVVVHHTRRKFYILEIGIPLHEIQGN